MLVVTLLRLRTKRSCFACELELQNTLSSERTYVGTLVVQTKLAAAKLGVRIRPPVGRSVGCANKSLLMNPIRSERRGVRVSNELVSRTAGRLLPPSENNEREFIPFFLYPTAGRIESACDVLQRNILFAARLCLEFLNSLSSKRGRKTYSTYTGR